MSDDFINIKSVSKAFRAAADTELLTVDSIDLSVSEGEFVCILGPSGCGKSTLLNMIAGFEKPTSGEILCAGKMIERPGADRGIVFQEHTLFEWMTVRENVMFGLTCNAKIQHQVPEPERRTQECIDLVGLTGFEIHLSELFVWGHETACRSRAIIGSGSAYPVDG